MSSRDKNTTDTKEVPLKGAKKALELLSEQVETMNRSNSTALLILKDPELLEEYVFKLGMLGSTIQDICMFLGVPRSTFYLNIKDYLVTDPMGNVITDEDGNPINKILDARRRGLQSMRLSVRGAMIAKALEGNVLAQKVVLENMDREVFFQQRVDKLEIEGKVKHTGAIASAELPFDQFVELCKQQSLTTRKNVDQVILEAQYEKDQGGS